MFQPGGVLKSKIQGRKDSFRIKGLLVDEFKCYFTEVHRDAYLCAEVLRYEGLKLHRDLPGNSVIRPDSI